MGLIASHYWDFICSPFFFDEKFYLHKLSLLLDCTGSTQAGLKWLKRIGSPADKTGGGKLSLEDAKTFYNVKQWTRTYRFPVAPEARSRLPIPGGYDKAVWMFTYFPLFGRGRRSFLIDKIEGHRSMYNCLCFFLYFSPSPFLVSPYYLFLLLGIECQISD